MAALNDDGVEACNAIASNLDSDNKSANEADDANLPARTQANSDTKKVANLESAASTLNPILLCNQVGLEDRSKRTTSTERCASSDINHEEKSSRLQMLNVGSSISDKPINNAASDNPISGVVSGRDETSPRRSVRQKLDFDLNLNDDQVPHDPSDLKKRSTSLQPFLRNIDLNGGPTIAYDDYPNLCLSSHHESAIGGVQVKHPVISLMGTKVEINRKDVLPKFMLFQDGKSPEAAIDVDLPRFNKCLQMVSPASQLTSSYAAPIMHPSYSHQQQFMNNLMGDEDGLMQLFPPGPVVSMDDRSSSSYTDLERPSSSSGFLGKRNESDSGGWESYPFGIKHHQAHWRGE